MSGEPGGRTMESILDLSEATGQAVVREGVGFSRRALARLVDIMVHFVVSIVVTVAGGILIAVADGLMGGDAQAALARLAVVPLTGHAAGLLGGLWLHVASEGLHGSTIGKRVCRITVIREDGGPANLAAALRRSIAFYVDTLFFGLVAWAKMQESTRRQRVGDLWAHTMVVRLDSLDPGSQRSGLRFLGAAALGLGGDGVVVFAELVTRVLE